jgi:hypothetical protein
MHSQYRLSQGIKRKHCVPLDCMLCTSTPQCAAIFHSQLCCAQVHLLDELLTDNFVWKVSHEGRHRTAAHIQQGAQQMS